MQNELSRRHFFFGAALSAALPAAGFGSTPSLKRVGFKSPNEKLNIGAIGAGGRATTNLAGCATENIVAFADPDDSSAAATYKKYETAAKYKDFRRMLDNARDLDAVIITTPDHTHAVAAYWCMQSGKHVYVEKPLAHTIWECRFLAQAAQRYGVATQMGNQGYSLEGERLAAEIIWSGEIGEIKEVHCWTDRPIWPQGMTQLPPEEPVPAGFDWDVWLGPAAMRPYSKAYAPFNWRGWLDFGSGALGDIACHVWGTVNMALRLAGSSCTVEVVKAEARSKYAFPKRSVTEFHFPARGALGPVKIVWTDAAEGPPYRPEGIPEGEPIMGGLGAFGGGGAIFTGAGPIPGSAGRGGGSRPQAQGPGGTFEGRRINTAEGSGAIFVGTKGYLTADTYGGNVRLLPKARHDAYKLPPQILSRSPGHYSDWIRACKGGEPACSNFSVAGPFAEVVQLGALAVRFEGRLDWDSARMRITNRPEANALLKPKFRKGWELA